jgi:hypothetical protein
VLAAARGITVPSRLRAEIAKIAAISPAPSGPWRQPGAPIRMQRWSVRRLAVTAGVLIRAAIAVSLVRANLTTVGLR